MNKMTIKKARFIARELKKAVFDRLAWWDLDGYAPTIKSLSEDIRTNPEAVNAFVLEFIDNQIQAGDLDSIKYLNEIHCLINHPEYINYSI